MIESVFVLVKSVVRGRIELPTFRFSGIRDSADQPHCRALSCDPRATSMLDHDRPGQLRRITMSRQIGQRRSYLSVTAIDSVQVTIGRGWGGMAEPTHQVLDRRPR